MAKMTAKTKAKKAERAGTPIVLPKATNFSFEEFCKAVNKVTTGNGIELLGDGAREAIAEQRKMEITPYAVLALISSYQSLAHDFQVELARIGKDPAMALVAISIDGIKAKLQDEKDIAALAKAEAATKRRK